MFSKEILKDYGIENVQEVLYNTDYNSLFLEETRPELSKLERGTITKTGAVAVDTGVFTGRSPNDKYVVLDDKTRDTVWW